MVQEVCNKALAYSYSEIRTIERTTLIMLKKWGVGGGGNLSIRLIEHQNGNVI